MHGCQKKMSLSSVFRTATYSGEQQWATGDGLSPGLRKSQSGIPAPPVVDQPHGAGGEPTTGQITGGVPTPTPLILEFVKTVLCIGTVAVQLRDTQNAFLDIRHQHGVFVDLGLASVHESKFQLALMFLGGDEMPFE